MGVTLVVAPLAVAACIAADTAVGRIQVLALTLVVFVLVEHHRSRDLLSPMVIVAALFAWLYVAKPLHVLDTLTISSGTSADAIVVNGLWRSAVFEALAAVTITISAVFVAFQVAHARAVPVRPARPTALHRERYLWAVAAAVVLDVVAFGVLLHSAGGLQAHVDGLALRSQSLAGRSFLTLATVPLTLVLLVGLTARLRGRSGAPGRGLVVALAVLALGSALLTGGRASLITGLVLPVAVVVHHAGRRIGPLVATAVATGCLAAWLTLGAVLRDTQFRAAPGVGTTDHVRDRFSHLHESTVGGLEAVPFDSLVRLIAARQFGELQWQDGATYRAIATWPVPRAWWPEKPAGGGNAWFSETYVPRFYGDAKVESSISFVGENYANFGWPGIVLGAVAMGLLIGLVHARLTRSADTFDLPLHGVLLGFMVLTFRSDAYHNVTGAVFVLAVWWCLRAFVRIDEPAPEPPRVPARAADPPVELPGGDPAVDVLVAHRRTLIPCDESSDADPAHPPGGADRGRRPGNPWRPARPPSLL